MSNLDLQPSGPANIPPPSTQTAPDSTGPVEDRILIVDDEAGIRGLFSAALSDHYECATAADAEEALALLRKESFALVISDMQMPGLSGVELLRRIISDFPDVVVIMVSGVDRSQRVIDAIRLGAYTYLLKPCDLDVLELTVARALERRTLLLNGKRYKKDLERQNAELAAQKAELIKLQAQLVQNEKMVSIGELAGGVAHELNNPAGFIYSNMETLGTYVGNIARLLRAYEESPLVPACAAKVAAVKTEINYERLLPELESIVEDCHEGARRISDIVANLRTFSRLDEANLKQVDLHTGIDATIRLVSKHFNANNITLSKDYGTLPMVECFAGQLNQVWMNLLMNAAQAIGNEAGEVSIVTRAEGDMASVSIRDTGPGIAPEHLNKLFDPFFTTKPVGEGTGLGLSITYGIIERHGGKITVDSVVGQGTKFTISIPIHAKPNEESANDQGD